MIIEIFSKLLSESLLSLYPVFVKYIQLPLQLKIWSRFFIYATIAALFIDYTYIFENLLSIWGLLLSFITLAHVYTSYRGFQLLESGISYTIFYLYPMIILLLAGKGVHPIMLLSLLGVYLLASTGPNGGNNNESDKKKEKEKENFENTSQYKDDKDDKHDKHDKNNNNNKTEIQRHIEDDKKSMFYFEGIVMIFLAALTEAIIYFIVLKLKTRNNWNHVFISYFVGAFLLSGFFFQQIKTMAIDKMLSLSLFGNLIIGLFGYYLRFFAMTRLDATVYAPLSYFGIFMAYVYGVIFNNDIITWQKVIGSVLIVVPNIYLSIYK